MFTPSRSQENAHFQMTMSYHFIRIRLKTILIPKIHIPFHPVYCYYSVARKTWGINLRRERFDLATVLEVPVHEWVASFALGLWPGSTSWQKCVAGQNHSYHELGSKRKERRRGPDPQSPLGPHVLRSHLSKVLLPLSTTPLGTSC